jgi:hypothetical protein
MSAGKDWRAFLEVGKLCHYGHGDPFRGRRDFVEFAAQALPNQPEPPGLD